MARETRRSRGHSLMSKQARSGVWPNSTCHQGGQSVPADGEDWTDSNRCRGEVSLPAAGEDSKCVPATGEDS